MSKLIYNNTYIVSIGSEAKTAAMGLGKEVPDILLIHKDIRYQTLIARMEELNLAGHTEEMIQTLEQLQTLSEIEQDDIGLAASYFYLDLLASSNHEPGDDEYMQYAKQALIISQAKNVPYYEMKASNSLGILYSECSDFHTGIEHYLNAIQIAEEHPEFRYASIVLNNVGNLFVWLEDFTAAISYLERAYLKGVEENHNDRELLSVICLNLVELYSNLQKYEDVQGWMEKGQEFLNSEERSVLICIGLINEARQLVQSCQREQAAEKLHAFLDLAADIPDYIYILHCCINALRLGIQLSDFSLCVTLMEKMERLQSSSCMTSFAYDYATVCAEYYQAFPEQLAQQADEIYKTYFTLSQNRINQLRSTYAKSLSVKIAFEEMKDENINVHLQNEKLQKDIERDVFTNLYNKVSTIEHVSAAMEARKADEIQALFLIDIDLFKTINDNYGHAFGDKVITKVAQTIEFLDEPNKIAGRFGGDEFLVFFYHQPSTDAIKQTADKMMAQIRGCIQLPDARVKQITTSVGIYVIDSDRTFADAFLDADQLLYRAKELGRNRFEISQ